MTSHLEEWRLSRPGAHQEGAFYLRTSPLNTNVPIALYQLGWYASDELKVTSNLKLTLSMRFDHLSNPVCQTNCFQSLSGPFQNLNRTAPVNQALTTGLHTAFPSVTSIVYQPKVGFAWSPLWRQEHRRPRRVWDLQRCHSYRWDRRHPNQCAK